VLAPLLLCLISMIFFQVLLIGSVSKDFYYIDETLLVVATLLIFVPLCKESEYVKLVLLIIVSFLVFFGLSYRSFAYRSEVTIVMALLIHFKFFFFFLLFYNFRRFINPPMLVNILFGLTIFGILLNFIMGEAFIHMMGGEVQHRFNITRPIGFQGSTGNMGFTLAFAFLLYALRTGRENLKNVITLTLIFVLLFIFSSVRTPFAALGIVLFLLLGGSLKKIFLGLIMLLPLLLTEYMTELIAITAENITSIIDPSESGYIRGIMIYFSVILAGTYFPFGTGAASYGSALSANSPVYQELGLSTSHFFVEMEGIYDSNFATLLGEFGVVGLALFMYLVWRCCRLIVVNGGHKKFIYGFIFVIFFYSLVAPVYMASYAAMFSALILVAAIDSKKAPVKEQKEEPKNELKRPLQ